MKKLGVAVIGTGFCAVMLFHFSKKVFFAGVIFFLVGLVLYSVFWEKKHKHLEHHERKSHKHIKHYAEHKKKSKKQK